MTRRTFLQTATAFSVSAPVQTSFGAVDIEAYQKELDAITPDVYTKFMKAGLEISDTEKAATLARYPGLKRYDAAFEKVFAEISQTTVTDKPAIWYVYNMGVVVKTPQTLFAIDLNHRQGERLAPLLDFMLVTHNHGDHYNEKLYYQMNRVLHKTVISNFLDNYGAYFAKVPGGYTHGPKEFSFKDVKIRTFLSDHNPYLIDFTMGYEITIGDYVIFHTGDSQNVGKLNPIRTPDLWMVHPRCGMKVASGIQKFHPKKTAILHMMELGHARNRWRFTIADGQAELAAVRAAGGDGVAPLWGDRLN